MIRIVIGPQLKWRLVVIGVFWWSRKQGISQTNNFIPRSHKIVSGFGKALFQIIDLPITGLSAILVALIVIFLLTHLLAHPIALA